MQFAGNLDWRERVLPMEACTTQRLSILRVEHIGTDATRIDPGIRTLAEEHSRSN